MDEIYFDGVKRLTDRAKSPEDARERLVEQIRYKSRLIQDLAEEFNLPTLGDWLRGRGWARRNTNLGAVVSPENAPYWRGIFGDLSSDPPSGSRNFSETPMETLEVFWGFTKSGDWLRISMRRRVAIKADHVHATILSIDIDQPDLAKLAQSVGQAYGIWDSFGLTLRNWQSKTEDKLRKVRRELHQFNAENAAIQAIINL